MEQMRDRLIELLKQINFDYNEECVFAFEDGYKSAPDFAEFFADRLLAEGVIVLPCKVGDTVYGYSTGNITEYTVTNIRIGDERPWVRCCSYNSDFWTHDIGKTVFFTREDAEQALKGEQSHATRN